jgi:hypothetical protein
LRSVLRFRKQRRLLRCAGIQFLTTKVLLELTILFMIQVGPLPFSRTRSVIRRGLVSLVPSSPANGTLLKT